MKKVYIASPYTIGDPVENVRKSLEMAERVIQNGDLPFCPLLCHLWHLCAPKPYQYWLEYSMNWLRQCDFVIRMPGESEGADKEVALARELGIPVMYC
jgi:hypothetical protein